MTMREKMARAVYAVSAKKVASPIPWEKCSQGYRTLVLEEIDAALDALLEPTPEVVFAGLGLREGFPNLPGMMDVMTGPVEQQFKMMILAIREGK